MMAGPIKIVEAPYLPPYLCASCGCDASAPRDWFLDTGIDVEVPSQEDGRMFICSACTANLVNVIPNAYSKQEMDDLVSTQQGAMKFATEANTLWKDKVEKFKSIGIDLEKVWDQIGPERTATNLDDVQSDGSDEPIVGDNQGTAESDSDVGGTKLHLNPLLA